MVATVVCLVTFSFVFIFLSAIMLGTNDSQCGLHATYVVLFLSLTDAGIVLFLADFSTYVSGGHSGNVSKSHYDTVT